jgi:hypothetical protein
MKNTIKQFGFAVIVAAITLCFVSLSFASCDLISNLFDKNTPDEDDPLPAPPISKNNRFIGTWQNEYNDNIWFVFDSDTFTYFDYYGSFTYQTSYTYSGNTAIFYWYDTRVTLVMDGDTFYFQGNRYYKLY